MHFINHYKGSDDGLHAEYRLRIVEYMRKHRGDFEPFVEDDVSFDDHIKSLAENGTFGGNDSIVAFARLMKVNVTIHRLDAPIWDVVCGPSKEIPTIHLVFHDFEHYSSTTLLDDAEQPIEASIAPQKISSGIRASKRISRKERKAGQYTALANVNRGKDTPFTCENHAESVDNVAAQLLDATSRIDNQ
eukprot:Ihof_evm4s230 gene=Ihof_evmTU4s230